MSINKDLAKVISYAESNNITVNILPFKRGGGDSAELDFDTRTITVWKRTTDSKTSILASILHELGHLTTFTTNPELFDEYFRISNLTTMPSKEERKEIYLRESQDISKMSMLRELLELKVNPLIIQCWQEFDTWQYKYYWLFGVYPTTRFRLKKRKELGIKYNIKF